jgi:spoIIIJ-associated protein
MQMKRVEADTLEEAYSKAAKALNCSVTEINCEIVQHPTSGMMGLFKKTAIIVAVKKINMESNEQIAPKQEVSEEKLADSQKEVEVNLAKENKIVEEKTKETTSSEAIDKVTVNSDKIVDDFFAEETSSEKDNETTVYDDDRDRPENRKLSIEIERKIQHLMKVGCVEIDTVEVDVFDGIAHIFIDGDDAALLIGKEGYRYNALSYMLFNWINAEYNLYIKLEIAEFIQAQEEMIDNYLKPIAEHIREHGKGKTKPLDGILVQIALEKLRAMFPNKYIAIKTGKDGKKFIIINDFNTKKK